MRMTPLISPPSCTSRRLLVMSPCMTLEAWISARSPATTVPRTSPPMIASRVMTSPSTSPPFATSTWRPARTVPTTLPSIFTTPSAVMSPTTRMPVPMIDSAASDSGAPCPFSVKMAMTFLLFHHGERVEGLALPPDLEVQVRRGRAPRAAGEGDHLARLHRIALMYQQPRRVPIHRFISIGMPQEDEHPVVGVRPGGLDGPTAGGAHRRAHGHGDVDPGMGLCRLAGPHLAASDEAGHIEGPPRGRGRPPGRARGGGGRGGGGAGGSGGGDGGSRHRQPRPHRHGARQVGAGRGDRSLLRRRAHAEQLAQLLVVCLRPIERRGELL